MENKRLLKALDMFVTYGILKETTKDGEKAWVENPDFNSKTPEEQAAVFQQIESAEGITAEVMNEIASGRF